MLMQLTKQNCSRQPALKYIENLCQKRLKLFEKMFNMSSIVIYTYYNSYLTFQLNTLKIIIILSADL